MGDQDKVNQIFFKYIYKEYFFTLILSLFPYYLNYLCLSNEIILYTNIFLSSVDYCIAVLRLSD